MQFSVSTFEHYVIMKSWTDFNYFRHLTPILGWPIGTLWTRLYIPVLVGKFFYTGFDILWHTSIHFNQFQSKLTKTSIVSNFNPLVPTSTNLLQSSKLFSLFYTLNNFNQLQPLNTKKYQLLSSFISTNFNQLHPFPNLYLRTKRIDP